MSPGNNNVLTWVRICVPPPQEAEQAAQAPHSRPDGQDVPTLQDWDCFLGSIRSDGWSGSLVIDHHHWASPDTSAFLAIPLTLDPPAPLDCSGAARCRAARPAAPRIRHWAWSCGGCCSRYLKQERRNLATKLKGIRSEVMVLSRCQLGRWTDNKQTQSEISI